MPKILSSVFMSKTISSVCVSKVSSSVSMSKRFSSVCMSSPSLSVCISKTFLSVCMSVAANHVTPNNFLLFWSGESIKSATGYAVKLQKLNKTKKTKKIQKVDGKNTIQVYYQQTSCRVCSVPAAFHQLFIFWQKESQCLRFGPGGRSLLSLSPSNRGSSVRGEQE